jgi:hypothetical protein
MSEIIHSCVVTIVFVSKEDILLRGNCYQLLLSIGCASQIRKIEGSTL